MIEKEVQREMTCFQILLECLKTVVKMRELCFLIITVDRKRITGLEMQLRCFRLEIKMTFLE